MTIDQHYVKRGNVFFEDGEWWYSRPKPGDTRTYRHTS